ncbi:MAG: branched-chain amino acid transport system ATP-binding protein [Actinomycetota bacterium]|jgi:branched-chain amino acid transport system ATP-binding protein
MTDVVLNVDGLETGFGASQILFGVDLTVRQGEIAGVLGLNGAGKSVMMKAIAGLIPVWKGTVTLGDRDITALAPEDRVGLGIGNVPQGRQVFPDLSVEENLRVGAYKLRRRNKARYPEVLATIFERFPKLYERRNQLAGTMSGGEQAALAVARALINEPSVMLVDEPSAGLAPLIVHDVFETLRAVAETGVTMVLVEQNVSAALNLVDTVTLLQTGAVAWSGPVKELDRSMLATQLGIGRLLGTPSKKKTRTSTRSTPSQGAKRVPVQKKKAAAKKKAAPVKKKAVAKKAPARKKAT